MHIFSDDNSYMFYFHDGHEKNLIVAKPTIIEEDKILFHFSIGYKSEGEWVRKSDILAVGDMENGTVQVIGWGGKYSILNNDRFQLGIGDGSIRYK